MFGGWRTSGSSRYCSFAFTCGDHTATTSATHALTTSDSPAKRVFLYSHIKIQLAGAFLINPFLRNHVVYESLVPLARHRRLYSATIYFPLISSALEGIFHKSLSFNNFLSHPPFFSDVVGACVCVWVPCLLVPPKGIDPSDSRAFVLYPSSSASTATRSTTSTSSWTATAGR